MKKKAKDGGKARKTPKNPEPRRARDANPRQEKYVAGVVAGKSKRRAAVDAGYSQSTADKPKELDARPGVQKLFQDLMREAGATLELLATRVYQGLNATIVGRETMYADREVFVDFKERREMMAIALKIYGALVEKHEVDAGPTLAELLEESFHG